MSNTAEISPDHKKTVDNLPTFSVVAENGTVYTMTFSCPVCDVHHVVGTRARYQPA